MACSSLLLFLFLSFQQGFSVDPTEYKCTVDFCLDNKCSMPDVEKCHNETLAILIPSPDACNCCEACLLFQEEGDACIVGSMGQSFPTQMCGKGLKCVERKCVKMDTNVVDPLRNENNYKCSNGHCQCVVPSEQVDITIFGSFPETDLEKGELQCGCSVLQYQVRNQRIRFLPFDGVYQPFTRCLANGQFDPLQCQEGVCSCIDPQTGEYDETIKKVSVLALGPGNPICFNATEYGHSKQYYRECEEAMGIVQRARDLAEAQGFQFLFPYKLDCQPDGNFPASLAPEVKRHLSELDTSDVMHSRFMG